MPIKFSSLRFLRKNDKKGRFSWKIANKIGNIGGKRMKAKCLIGFMVCTIVIGSIGSISLYAQKTTVNFWSQYNRPADKNAVEYIMDIFEKENPDVKIAHRIMPNLEADQMLRTAFAGGNPPDVSISEDPYTMVKTFLAGQLADLTEWYEQYGDRFSEGAKLSFRTDGRYFGIPTTMVTEAHMFYNKKLAETLGIAEPQDYDEFLEACETAKGHGFTAVGLGNQGGWPGLHWYQAFLGETVGAEMVNTIINRSEPDVGPKWTDPGFVSAARYFDELHKRGYVSEGVAMMSYDASKMEYLGGKALFFFTGSWYTSFDFPPDFEWGFFRFPHIVGEVGYSRNDGTVDYLAKLQVASATANLDLALKFLEVFSRSEVMYSSFFKFGGHMPAVIGAVPAEELGDFQKAAIAFMQETTGSYGFIETQMPPAVGFGGLYNGTTAISAGEMTPLEFAQNLEKIHVEEISR
ncbi:hypothetical protein CEE34_02215 [Candidatus Aerophobetes bacterium Ae_b3a]|nr:MAG: hypothetical protein CEE34_02215 [Candidatus Aerophobetes bacterium Ae_b3a]